MLLSFYVSLDLEGKIDENLPYGIKSFLELDNGQLLFV